MKFRSERALSGCHREKLFFYVFAASFVLCEILKAKIPKGGPRDKRFRNKQLDLPLA